MSDQINTASTSVPRVYDGYEDKAVRGWPPGVEQFAGVVRDGPNSPGQGDDYADARYYVDRALPSGSATGAFAATADSLPGVRQTVTATNLAEMTAGTHLIAAGSAVQVFSIYERSGGGKQYVFNLAPVSAVVVEITSTGGDGEYDGTLLAGKASALEGGSLMMPMGMTVGGRAIILNLEEDNLPGHRLKIGSYANGVIRGTTGGSDPQSIVVISGGVGSTDSPVTIGSDSNTSEAADTGTWSRLSGSTPVNVFLATRVVYNPTGDETIYAFVRELSFDARGLLYSVGAEHRMTVDITESCP